MDIQLLEDIGLTKAQALIYITLVQSGKSTAGAQAQSGPALRAMYIDQTRSKIPVYFIQSKQDTTNQWNGFAMTTNCRLFLLARRSWA